MKNYLNELSDRFEEEIEKFKITAILADDDDVIIESRFPVPLITYNYICKAALETHYEGKTFEDLETLGCDQDHAERDNEL